MEHFGRCRVRASRCSAPCFEPHSSNITCPCSYQVTLSIERAWQSCFQPISHRVSGLRQGDRTITVTSYDMVATTQIHVLGLDIYGYGAPPTICYYRFSVLHSSKSSSRALV